MHYYYDSIVVATWSTVFIATLLQPSAQLRIEFPNPIIVNTGDGDP